MRLEALVVLLALLLFCLGVEAVEIENSVSVQSIRVAVSVEGSGEISGNLMGQKARIEVLSFKDTPMQRVVSLNESLEINGKTVGGEERTDDWGNKYALFRVGETGSFSYRIDAVIETDMGMPVMNDFDLGLGITDFEEFKYPSENIESNTEAIRTAALNRFDSNSWLHTVADVTKWTYDYIDYDLSYYPESYSAVSTLGSGKGVCDEFSVLAAAMLRAKGIPTRVVSGLTYNPKEGGTWNNHTWIEAFNPDGGWIPADPTFAEAGLINGTHLSRGIFPDPSESSGVKATMASTASIDVGSEAIDVEVESVALSKTMLLLGAEDVVIPANRWHELKIQAENPFDSSLIAWLFLAVPEDFAVDDKRQMIVFQPYEEKEIVWNLRINKDLKERQFLTTSYIVTALGKETEQSLKVVAGDNFSEEALVKVIDTLSFVQENKLVVEVKLENLGSEPANVMIKLGSVEKDVAMEAFEKRFVRIAAPMAGETQYRLSAEGPGLDYMNVISVHEEIPWERPSQSSPIAFLPDLGQVWESASGWLLESAALIGIIIGLVVIAVLLKELLSK